MQTLEDTASSFTGSKTPKPKTKIRRLYDITNVFKAMGLIKKVTSKNRKIAIEWQGLKGFDAFLKEKNEELEK